MQAILRGVGDSFILGCNHPIWPSLGLIHGSRSSGDISRRWPKFRGIARENLSRNWQNGKLWWNDPDAVVLTGNLSEDEFLFHATMAYAAGGMILSGDDLTKIPPQKMAMLKKLLPPTGRAAVFEDESLRLGFVDLPGERAACVFNWEDQSQDIKVPLARRSSVKDFWTGANLGTHEGAFEIRGIPPHSARILILTSKPA
jgi:alpha-galactosidase